ncbi:MAG: amino-acid N-acetyltransferase [Treponema sp.]|nr:amino-acid N-acetyltransferase [Treponema sp.]
MNKGAADQVELIREVFGYQTRFEDSTMVFKIDFAVTEDPGFAMLMQDLALLARTGFRVVIVPGAKEMIDLVLGEYGISSRFAGSHRITPAPAMPFVEMAAFHVATRFMTGLASGSPVRDGRVDAVIGTFVRARGLGIVDGVDMEHTGQVDRVFTESIDRILKLGMIPILPCIGWSPVGKPYNVPSDEIALAVAGALGAVKLFIISARGGIRRGMLPIPESIKTSDQGQVIRLTPQEAESLLEHAAAGTAGTAPNEAVLAELRLALRASRAGVERIHMIDGREAGAVLRELFSNQGAGTMVYADEYESIRPLREADIPGVLRLMEPLMREGILIRRTAEDIRDRLGDYLVYEIDGSVHACGALHDRGENQGEIAAIATDPAYSDMGLGSRVVRRLIDRAEDRGLGRVFVLTTRTHDWFEFLGFQEASLESLPVERQQSYDRTRNSMVFALDISRDEP